MFDGKAFGQDIVAAVKDHIDRSVLPLTARLDALEKRLAELPVPKDGVDADPDKVAGIVLALIRPDLTEMRNAVAALPEAPELPDIAGMIAEAVRGIPTPEPLPDVGAMVTAAVAALPPPAAGKDAELAVIQRMVSEAVALLPPAKDGAPADPVELQHMVSEAIAALPPAEPGKDADPALVASLVKEAAARILAGWERPQDGKSVTAEELRPLVEEAVGRAVAAIPVPKDAVNLAGALIDRDGNLVLTLSNGTTAPLGRVEGKDGADVDMAAIERSIAEKVAALPKPKDGADGVGFDDMDLVETESGVVLRFIRGEVVKDFRLPIVVDRGVWKEGTFRKGDGCTWGGSFWICQVDETSDKPDSGKGWRLAIKKGRDGKDVVLKPAPEHKPVKVG